MFTTIKTTLIQYKKEDLKLKMDNLEELSDGSVSGDGYVSVSFDEVANKSDGNTD